MKRTAKLLAAQATVLANNIPVNMYETADLIYSELQRAGWWWQSKTGKWERGEAAQPAMDDVMVRVWAATGETLEMAVNDVVAGVEECLRLKLVERSEPYQCRPPKQNESRVYLRFRRR